MVMKIHSDTGRYAWALKGFLKGLHWFIFMTLAISGYASYTIRPVHAADGEDLSMGSREYGSSEAEQLWEYGGFIDGAYLLDFNFPPNHQFRSKVTTPRVNEFNINMAGASIRKEASETSRLGAELLVHAGEDSKDFGFANGAPKVGSSDELRHFGRANMSYLAPVGRGLMLQAGLFNSLIGYESLYAKDNANYTRAWVADYSPYLMFGINASYPLRPDLTGTVFVINEYAHLSHANDLPSYGVQLAWRRSPRLLLQQTVYYGPDQSDTDMKYWRLFSDSIVKWQQDELSVGFDYQIGTERIVGFPDTPRAFWTGASMPVQWHINDPWSVTVRPEFYWDRNGRLTGSEQFIKALTTTLAYRTPVGPGDAIFRLEYRFDESTGQQGGFYSNIERQDGSVGLTNSQHLLIFSAVWTFSAHPKISSGTP